MSAARMSEIVFRGGFALRYRGWYAELGFKGVFLMDTVDPIEPVKRDKKPPPKQPSALSPRDAFEAAMERRRQERADRVGRALAAANRKFGLFKT